jgi:hypothetical protein
MYLFHGYIQKLEYDFIYQEAKADKGGLVSPVFIKWISVTFLLGAVSNLNGSLSVLILVVQGTNSHKTLVKDFIRFDRVMYFGSVGFNKLFDMFYILYYKFAYEDEDNPFCTILL